MDGEAKAHTYSHALRATAEVKFEPPGIQPPHLP